MDAHAWSNFTTKCGPLVQLKRKIWIYFQNVLRHQHDSTKHPVPFSRGTHLSTSCGTKTPKPFSREIHGVHLVEKTTWKKQTRKAAPDEQETPKRGIWHRPKKKATKEPKHERQHPTSKKHPSDPSEGFGIAPKKGKKKHERQHPTSKKHPSEGFGIAPKKGKAALG